MRNKLCASLAGVALISATVAPAAAAATSSTTPFVRGVYGRDSSPDGVSTLRATGFDTVTVQPWRDHLDGLASAGMRGVVWLFGYDNATCAFDRDDAWVRETVGAIAGHSAIAAYNVADEPNYRQCPDAPAEIAARARLVKSLDPSKPTYVVVAAWDGREGFPYQHFAGTTDIMGLDVYPCSHSMPTCKYADIDSAIEEAVADGVQRYWAILQDFGDAWYRLPTAAELERQFDHWAASGMEGYFLYHWNEGGVESRPDHLTVLRQQNARAFGNPAPTPAPSPSPAPAPSPAPVPSTVPVPLPGATPSPEVSPAPSTDVPDGASPVTRPVSSTLPGRPTKDRKPPSRPRTLFSAPLASGSYLWWDAASDDRSVAGYVVWRDGRRIGRTTSTSFEDPKSLAGKHVYAVRAFDEAGNRSRAAVLRVSTWRRGSHDLASRPCPLSPWHWFRSC